MYLRFSLGAQKNNVNFNFYSTYVSTKNDSGLLLPLAHV